MHTDTYSFRGSNIELWTLPVVEMDMRHSVPTNLPFFSTITLYIYFLFLNTIKPLNLLQFQAFSYDIASGLFIHPSLQHLNLLIQNIIIPVVLTALDVLCQVVQNEGDGVLFLLSEIRAEMFSNIYIITVE